MWRRKLNVIWSSINFKEISKMLSHQLQKIQMKYTNLFLNSGGQMRLISILMIYWMARSNLTFWSKFSPVILGSNKNNSLFQIKETNFIWWGKMASFYLNLPKVKLSKLVPSTSQICNKRQLVSFWNPTESRSDHLIANFWI